MHTKTRPSHQEPFPSQHPDLAKRPLLGFRLTLAFDSQVFSAKERGADLIWRFKKVRRAAQA